MWGLPKYKWIHTFHSLSIIVYLDHSAGWIPNISFQLWPWNLRPSHFYFCFTFKSSTFHSLLQSGRFAPFCYLDWLCIVRLPTTFIFSLFTCLTCLNWIFAPIFSLFLYLLEIYYHSPILYSASSEGLNDIKSILRETKSNAKKNKTALKSENKTQTLLSDNRLYQINLHNVIKHFEHF